MSNRILRDTHTLSSWQQHFAYVQVGACRQVGNPKPSALLQEAEAVDFCEYQQVDPVFFPECISFRFT